MSVSFSLLLLNIKTSSSSSEPGSSIDSERGGATNRTGQGTMKSGGEKRMSLSNDDRCCFFPPLMRRSLNYRYNT